jgi:hypothetical protein
LVILVNGAPPTVWVGFVHSRLQDKDVPTGVAVSGVIGAVAMFGFVLAFADVGMANATISAPYAKAPRLTNVLLHKLIL